MSEEKVYEMLWDCPQCDTKGLLGKTQRYCPACGAPQDPKTRYFPSEEQKVAVQDHVFQGADKTCPACDTPMSAAASNCSSCGSPLDGAKGVDLKQDTPDAPKAPKAAPPNKKSKRKSFKLAGCGCLALIGLIGAFLLVNHFWTRSATVTVTAHSWERAITVERYKSVTDSDWCDELPSGAHDVSRSRKQRDTRKVADGQTCTKKNKDQGDGTFKQVEECEPRYREEAVEDDWCTYEVDKWSEGRTARNKGTGLSSKPSWPDARVHACQGKVREGCEREGARVATYTLTLKESDGGTEDCAVEEGTWTRFKDDVKLTVQKKVMTGGLRCETLKP